MPFRPSGVRCHGVTTTSAFATTPPARRGRLFRDGPNPFRGLAPPVHVPVDAGTDREVFMIVGIAITAGAVLLCTCSYVVVRRRRQARG
ncbi:predicted protein [Streptomyces pristinaespiralis ATCC 25486]|uniref:Predicted protein n=1 Tax=Streptomyces pristinaespiralis (strain ATCC 25486 / DSM 40338 / CBS 914.69 / JCM 4507 / KCC S-0507 / NBRC 13074 / NRRL 2958 / 5647) TaxID=457429 RepID=D6X6Z2_STRE2|nr:predicted protein [Streptomyces pristinaespiralis ATCC 25486]